MLECNHIFFIFCSAFSAIIYHKSPPSTIYIALVHKDSSCVSLLKIVKNVLNWIQVWIWSEAFETWEREEFLRQKGDFYVSCGGKVRTWPWSSRVPSFPELHWAWYSESFASRKSANGWLAYAGFAISTFKKLTWYWEQLAILRTDEGYGKCVNACLDT